MGGSSKQQLTRPGLITVVLGGVDWSSSSFQGKIKDFCSKPTLTFLNLLSLSYYRSIRSVMTGTCLVGLKCLSMTLLIFCFHRHSVGLARCKRIWKCAKLLARVYYRVGTFAKYPDHVASVLQPFRDQAKIRSNGFKGFDLNLSNLMIY